MFACKCLNIIIYTEKKDILKCNPSDLLCRSDLFFKQDIWSITNNAKILNRHSRLVNTRSVGSWNIHECINCKTSTHASSTSTNLNIILISSHLVDGDQIENLKMSNNYSRTFNIIIDASLKENDNENCVTIDVDGTVIWLKNLTNDMINREKTATEDRVRQYTDQQYSEFEEFKDKALDEQKILTKIVLNASKKSRESELDLQHAISTGDCVPDKITNTPVKSFNTKTKLANSPILPASKKPNHRSAPRSIINKTSYDAQGLFPLEDMEDSDSYPNSEADVTDNEDSRDEGIHLPRSNRPAKLSIAKSLPMNIPIFMSPLQDKEPEDDDDMLPTSNEDQMDIAASIKALAKSVHGDTVFGDLPRPRFSTNI